MVSEMSHPEVSFLIGLHNDGYFNSRMYDPQQVYTIAKRLNINNDQLIVLINHMVKNGLILVEYDKDPSLHPKDQLDMWRIALTDEGKKFLDDSLGTLR